MIMIEILIHNILYNFHIFNMDMLEFIIYIKIIDFIMYYYYRLAFYFVCSNNDVCVNIL